MSDKILSPKEIKIIHMALEQLIDDVLQTSKNQSLPFTGESRSMMKDMLQTASSALAKLQKTTGYAVKMDEYKEGDENEFMTKES